MKYIVLLMTITLASCASKFPMKIEATEYIKGLEETDSMDMLPSLLQKSDYCLLQSPELDNNRSLQRKHDQKVLYTYELSSLLKTHQSDRVCNENNSITINDIKFTWEIYNTMRLHRYIVDLELVTSKKCVSQEMQFVSQQQQRLNKKGFHGHEVSTTIFAAALNLVLNDALIDIRNQIQEQCIDE